MSRSLKSLALGMVAVAGMLCIGVAQARSNVYFSVDLGVPTAYPRPVYIAPPAVAYAPPAIYVQPTVIYAPRPIFVRPAPIYYYGQPAHYNGERERRRHREHDDEDD